MYRQLGIGDTISDGDEFLDDDCVTWNLVSSSNLYAWVIGAECKGNLKPFRRPTKLQPTPTGEELKK